MNVINAGPHVPGQNIPEEVATMARTIVETFGGNPQLMVQPGSPQVFGTPSGECFAVQLGSEIPLWRQYIAAAEKMLAACRAIDGREKKPLFHAESAFAEKLKSVDLSEPTKSESSAA